MVKAYLGKAAAAAAGLCLGATALASPAQAPRLTALADVRPGQWLLQEQGGNSRSICIRNPETLLQMHNRRAACSRIVAENTANVASVHYTCPGHGNGRTTIKVETGRLIQIESEGVDGGVPFSMNVEGRRTGACGRR